ncbi:MAG: polyprenyl synthetase family protein [Verrucomicrobiaceae bacterium]|nr:polyprenyl synthetase family protein [Verrucomicrobiaceae bacterium]
MELKSPGQSLLADESTRSDSAVEWWFVQGRYKGEGSEPREFMVSLFRHALEWAGLSMGNACTFIGAVLDPVSGKHATVSLADPNTMPFLVKASKHYPPPGLDAHVVRLVAQELADHGPPRPVRVESKRPRFQSKPFAVEWGDFQLTQEAGCFVLAFTEPESGRRCRFRLRPTHARFHLAGVEVPDGGSMDYVSYTRLALEGEVDGRPVTGEAWLDHQWGSQGWVVGGKRKERILGWDWLGIQLQDHELLVMAHRDQKTGEILCRYAVLVDAEGKSTLHRDVVLTPRRNWTSPHTGAVYPVCWEVAVPSLDLRLDFEPLADDQEIPMLPPIRAVWEGAGRVSGRFRGAGITGWARLELHGYAYLVDLGTHLNGIVTRVRQHLEDALPRRFDRRAIERMTSTRLRQVNDSAFDALVSAPLWDLMDRDKARLWYALPGLLMIGALGTNAQPYEQLACVTAEMLRGGAEIIDDIQDKAARRRGGPPVHARHGVDAALCAANAAFFLPFTLLAEYPGLDDAQRLELYRITSRLCMQAQMGQVQDVHATMVLTPELLQQWIAGGIEERVLQFYDGKAASFTIAAMEAAAVIAKADAATRAACASFGHVLGLALQIVNDVANFSREHEPEAGRGSDLAEGKLTFVLARSFQLLKSRPRSRLVEIFCSPNLRHDPGTRREALELIHGCGALESCRKTARQMLEQEWTRLSRVLPPSEPKIMLRVLWEFILDLDDRHRDAAFIPA